MSLLVNVASTKENLADEENVDTTVCGYLVLAIEEERLECGLRN